jgi:hypothetical protein
VLVAERRNVRRCIISLLMNYESSLSDAAISGEHSFRRGSVFDESRIPRWCGPVERGDV